jgi:teichoic acid transport system permease protein
MTAAPEYGTPEYSTEEYVFEPHSATLPNIPRYVQGIWDRRRFIVELTRADMRTLRARTALGNIWNVLDPLFQAGIYFFLYTVLRSGGSQTQFLPVLVSGMFFFGLSLAAFSEGGNSIRRSRGLMLNSSFPRALLPVAAIYKSVRSFVPIACTLVVIFPLLGGTLGMGLFLLPLLFALQIIMNIGIALLFSTYTVLVPDAQNVMNWITRILFFVTPVIYPVTILSPSVRPLISWQPLFALFAAYQAVFSGRVPSFGLVVQTAIWAAVLLVVGGWFFLRREREFAMHL